DAAGGFGMSLEQVLEQADRIVHGTTTGTNALITREGARVGLLTTAGHGDAIAIMKGAGRLAGLDVEVLLDLPHTGKPEQLVPQTLVAEVTERIGFEGDVVGALDEASAQRGLERLVADGATAVTVSLLWSPRNDAHEQRVAALVRERHPELYVTAASEVSAH